MTHCEAWLIHSAEDFRFACGMREFVEIVSNPSLVAIPGTPAHCRHLTPWRDRWIPVMRPAQLQKPHFGDIDQAHMGILCYQLQPASELQYGAVVLAGQPEKIHVADSDVCALPEAYQRLEPITLSCFEYAGQAVPVFDLKLLFSLPATAYSD